MTSVLYQEMEKCQTDSGTGKLKASLATERPPLKDQAPVHMNIYRCAHKAAVCLVGPSVQSLKQKSAVKCKSASAFYL